MAEKMTTEALAEQVARLMAENESLKAKQPKAPGITLKVSAEKKCLSVYGIGRYPVTLYKGQWQRLLKESANIEAFIAAHPELAEKV